ncbi:MAG: hypothetical protein LLG04_10460, partial [Parachlamydia sp.]|nr:hypothetical protein [Parachlamydia sp.]
MVGAPVAAIRPASDEVKLGDFATANCDYFKNMHDHVKDKRDEDFKKRNKVQQAAYHVFNVMQIAALVAFPACVALAAVISIGYIGYAAVAAVALFVFAKLRGDYNTMTNDEEQIISKYKDPLGLDNNKGNVPEVSVLKKSRAYFEKLVAEPKNEKEKKDQQEKFKVAQKLFDKNIEPDELKKRVATLAVTSLLLESIQHLYQKNQKLIVENCDRLEKGRLIDHSSFDNVQKAKIRYLTAQLRDPSKEFPASFSKDKAIDKKDSK